MDIESAARVPSGAAIPRARGSSSVKQRPATPAPKAQNSPDLAAKLGQAYKVVSGANLPRSANVSVRLNVDDGSGRVFATVVNKQTGEVIEQIPREGTLRLLAVTRELLGSVYDTKV